ncbi:fibronectin type III domain-containing protein 9 [Sebastes umbrosus]|uniref:fibronectin type III domain-containing protein 9 n=1 Tax=Sebastes umbrosus TaxID=72105 RepID=UPI0018A02520|nr:fibronectin type III domain-containing protein 9 [Sebastes umbrosus]
MGVAVYNISSTSARVSWPPSPSCLDTFYSVMYDPNWNSLLMSYKRKSFMHEERIPVSQSSTHLANLLPQTAYFLCVTCQAANPVRDQCQVFSTPSDNSEGHDRAGWELAMGVWLTCCILLLVIAGILLWGCLHTICSTIPSQGADGCHVATNSNSMSRQDMSGSGRLYAHRRTSEDSGKRGSIMQPPLHSTQTTGHIITQDHELRTLAKLSGSEPA